LHFLDQPGFFQLGRAQVADQMQDTEYQRFVVWHGRIMTSHFFDILHSRQVRVNPEIEVAGMMG
jgi:hypothetical protein